MTSEWLLVLGCIFAVNLLPAFGPPTWAVLVFFNLNYDLPAVPLILFGALAAAGGRLVLALTARHFRERFSPERRDQLAAAEQVLVGSRGKAAAVLGLFALSPVPSAQLFVAAGLLTVPLVPLTVAFFAGRLVSYSIYVSAAAAAEESLGAVLARRDRVAAGDRPAAHHVGRAGPAAAGGLDGCRGAHERTSVPASPASAAGALDREQTEASRPPLSTKRAAVSAFGPIDTGGGSEARPV